MQTYKLFLIALGIVLVIEGAPYAFFPAGMKKMIVQILGLSDGVLRLFGFILLALGFLLVALTRM